MQSKRWAAAFVAGCAVVPAVVGVFASGAEASTATPIAVNTAVRVHGGDYLLTVHGLTAPTTTVGEITQEVGGSAPAQRVADIQAGPSASTATAEVRTTSPDDTFSITMASAAWSSITLTAASWSFLVRGTSVTSAGGANVTWHGVSVVPSMSSNDFSQMIDDFPGVKITRLPVDERCWDPFFTTRPAGCSDPGTYQASIKAAVSSVTSLGDVVLLVASDAGRDDPSWGGTTTTDQFGPDQQTLVMWHQLDQLFGNNPRVVFETMNEPKMIVTQSYSGILGADLWRTGGKLTVGATTWNAPGVQQIVDTIRGDGASNLVLVQGAAWGSNLTPVEAKPVLGTNLAYSFHGYHAPDNSTTYPATLDRVVAPILDPNGSYQYAGMMSEFGTGQSDSVGSGSAYLTSVINWANSHHVGWIAFGWYPESWDHYGLLTSYKPLSLNSRAITVVNKL